MDDFRKREGDQDLPTPNDEVSCQERFMTRIAEAMPARMELGKKRYGSLLQPFNGRDFMRDAFEELLDLSVYLEGVAAERKAMFDLLDDLRQADTVEQMRLVRAQARWLLASMGRV